MTRIPSVLFVVSGLVVGFAVQAGDDPPAKVDSELIRGTVVDEQDRPVAGVEVKIPGAPFAADRATTTGPDGRFAIDARGVAARVSGKNPIVPIDLRLDGGRLWSVYDNWAFARLADPHRLVISPAHRVEVEVVDGTGLPIAGAAVGADLANLPIYWVKQKPSEAITDDSGRAVLLTPSNGSAAGVAAYKAGSGWAHFSSQRSFPGLPGERLRLPDHLRLTLDGARTVRVVVKDQDGRPIEGVKVEPFGRLQATRLDEYISYLGPDPSVLTNSLGFAEFVWFPRRWDQSATFRVKHPDFEMKEPWLSISPSSADGPVTFDATMIARAKVRGRIIGVDGRPVPDVEILHGPSIGEVARANPDGTYEVSVQAQRPNLIEARAEDGGRASATIEALAPGAVREGVDLNFQPGVVIRGRVTEAPTGLPVRGARIDIFRWVSNASDPVRSRPPDVSVYSRPLSGFTDEDGRLTATVEKADYRISALFFGQNLLAAENRVVEVKGDGPIDVDLVVARRGAEVCVLAGRVVNEDGTPCPDLIVRGYSTPQTPETRGLTDADGRFRLRARREPTFLYVFSADQPARAAALALDIAGEAEPTLTLKPAGWVTGRVVDPQDRPGKDNTSLRFEMSLPRSDDKPPQVTFVWSQGAGDKGSFGVSGIPVGAKLSVRLPAHTGPNAVRSVLVERAEEFQLDPLIDDPATQAQVQ